MRTDERDDWRQAYAVLDELLDLPVAERGAALAARPLPPAVEAIARRLLAGAEREDGVLHRPLPWDEVGEAVPPAALAGARFGPYEVVEEIGRGGMSVVFRARRADGQFERDVALKLLTMGQLAAGSEERLRREQAILARLEHPGIATLHDGGLAPDGTPWLAMELVDGDPIDVWAAGQDLDARGAVQLFLQVCDAVAFAHRNLVVHRDLKPGNIFVDRAGRVRLLDFGIAKLLGETAPEATATRVLTPGYGAPEQLTGRGVTTATDVYGMGAVLYRLLAGRPPFVGRERLLADPASIPAPPPPSTLSTRLRGADADLDNAVLKALRPESERRYPTAEALRDDLECWLDGRPLSATPDSLGYRLRKYVSRHRRAAAAVVLAAGGLVAGTSVALWQAALARQESRRAQAAAADAEQQLRRAEEVTRFLVDTFANADPYATGSRDVTAEEIVAQGVKRIDRELEGQPQVRRQLLAVLGEITYQLGDLARAEELLGKSLAIAGVKPEERVQPLRYAALVASARGDYETAERHFSTALALGEQGALAGERRAALELDYLAHLSNSDQEQRVEERVGKLLASPWFTAVGEVPSAHAAIVLATSLGAQGRFAEARESAARGVAVLERRLDERDLELASARSILANLEADLGELRTAEALERRSLEVFLEVHGTAHPRTLLSQNSLATHLKNLGRFTASAELLAQVLAAQTATLGADHPFVASTHFNLGEARLLAGDAAGALSSYRRAVEMAETNPSDLAARRGMFHAIYGRALGKTGDARAAETQFGEGLRLLAEAPGAAHPLTARVQVEYAGFLNDRGRPDEARRRLGEAMPILVSTYGEDSRELALARLQLGRALTRADPAAAREALARARKSLAASAFRERYAAEIAQASTLLAGSGGS